MNQLRYFLLISLIAHAGLIGLAWWGASLFQLVDLGGGGGDAGVVSVWLAGQDGTAVGEAGMMRPRPPSGHPSEMAARAPSGASSDESGGGGSGPGEGIGDGQGPGIGAGRGGDPTLAQIWRKINRSKYYPELARRERLEGAPRVTFSINADGSVGRVDLAASCGQAILDEAAIETVRRAAPLPYYSAPITLAVRYELR